MKTPKREHYSCWRCGGLLDVHLDPSGETEEYSICRDCHRKTISHCGHTWEPYKQRARWIRKNREARLRNRIRVDLYHRMMEKYWKNCTMDCLDALTMREDMDGAFGQDVEGS